MIKKQSSLHNILLILIFVLIASTTVNSQFLRTSGKEIIDKNDNPIILRGLGLGGWMLQEPYMMKVSGGAANQKDFKAKIEDLIGPERTREFYDAWLENFITKADIDSMALWGFNSVRVPMHYNLYTLPIEVSTTTHTQTLCISRQITSPICSLCSIFLLVTSVPSCKRFSSFFIFKFYT